MTRSPGQIAALARAAARNGIVVAFAGVACLGLAVRSGAGSVRVWPDVASHAIGVALAAALVCASRRRCYGLAAPAVLAVVALLALTRIPGIARGAFGADRWLQVGGVAFQPSELAKPALVLAGAAWPVMVRASRRPAVTVLAGAASAAAVVGLVARQPDFSTAFLLLVTFLLAVALHSPRAAAIVLLPAVTAVGAAAARSPHVAARVDAFVYAEQRPQSGGYQIGRARAVVAGAAWWGPWAGDAAPPDRRPPSVPSGTRDFALVAVVATFGLGAALACLAALAAGLLARAVAPCYEPAFEQRLAALGIAALYGQAAVNSLSVFGLFPVIGVPFPFLSAGGTSTVATWLLLGLVYRGSRGGGGRRRRTRGPARPVPAAPAVT